VRQVYSSDGSSDDEGDKAEYYDELHAGVCEICMAWAKNGVCCDSCMKDLDGLCEEQKGEWYQSFVGRVKDAEKTL
jgi:hypothetical protein